MKTMLTIRLEQCEVLGRTSLRHFEDEMVEHLNNFAPKHCEVIKESGIRTVIRLGIERAKEYGFTNRGPVRFYIELMFMFGSYFDTDSQYQWAGEVLSDRAVSDQMFRANGLYHRATRYVERISGPNHVYSIEALRRLTRPAIESLALGADFHRSAVIVLTNLYPQKSQYLGQAGLRTVIQRASELAARHSVTAPSGIALFIAATFAIGHCFVDDPLFPWISATLNNTGLDDPNERVERLFTKMLTYLRHSLSYIEGKSPCV
jgi:hypothetical protein